LPLRCFFYRLSTTERALPLREGNQVDLVWQVRRFSGKNVVINSL
jgi:hypothetical protein